VAPENTAFVASNQSLNNSYLGDGSFTTGSTNITSPKTLSVLSNDSVNSKSLKANGKSRLDRKNESAKNNGHISAANGSQLASTDDDLIAYLNSPTVLSRPSAQHENACLKTELTVQNEELKVLMKNYNKLKDGKQKWPI